MFLLLGKDIFMSAIPRNFEEWKICIEKKCGNPLTLEFAEKRLSIYRDENLPETQRFMKLYGEVHLFSIREWLSKIIKEIKEKKYQK